MSFYPLSPFFSLMMHMTHIYVIVHIRYYFPFYTQYLFYYLFYFTQKSRDFYYVSICMIHVIYFLCCIGFWMGQLCIYVCLCLFLDFIYSSLFL